MLRKAGIVVETGVEEEKLREQNRVFLKYITTRRPWIVMKTAMTLDGKIAAYTGDSLGDRGGIPEESARNAFGADGNYGW